MTITVPIVLISALAIGLTVFLNVGKLDRTLGELEQSRLHFTIDNLRENLETGLDLGLPVAALGNAQAAIDAEARQDPDIVSISVTGEDGALAFHTGRPADTDVDVIRAGLSNNLGARAGAIELHYSRRRLHQFIADFSSQLLTAALAAIAISTLLALAGIRLWVRRIGRTLSSIEHTLDADAPPLAKVDRRAAALAEQVQRSAHAALHELDEAERAIDGGGMAGERQ